jgi:hypothetical protein
MDKLKNFENFDSINESRDVMINVIRNILKEIYKGDEDPSIDDVISHFADKLFLNDEDKNSFYKSIIG